MKESNEFLLEGLYQDGQRKNKDEEQEEEEEDKDDDGLFIHERDALQRSTEIKKRKTLAFPKSNLNIEGKNKNKGHNKTTIFDKDIEPIDDNALEFINEHDLVHEEAGSRYFNFEEILCIEDPFMRISKPLGVNNTYQRISAFNQRSKTKKHKKEFFFGEKPKTMKGKDCKRTKSVDVKVGQIGEMTEKTETEQIKEAIEDEEDESEEKEKEEKDKGKGKTYIDLARTSFLSRNSIDFEEDDYTFEVEVVDSVAMTVLQVINCMIKANLVQIATSMKSLGLIWGPITICLIAIMSLISLNLILEVNRMTGIRSYLIFSEEIFGHFGSIIILICQFMSAFGGCLSFIVIFNKVVPTLLNFSLSNPVLSDDKIFSISLGVIMFFYCYKQDINIIKSAAKYAVFAILLFFFVTILDFIVAVFSQDRLINLNSQWNSKKRDEILYGLNTSDSPNRIPNVITAVACIILSYSFHIFTFSIYGCMGKISRKQFFITTSVSVLITTIIYLICGTIGYLLYYDTLTDSILDSVQESWLSSLLSLANVINVIMTFPITFGAVKNYFLLFVGIILTLIRDCFLCAFSCIPKVENIRGRTSNARITKVFRKGNNSYLMSGKPLIKFPKYIEFLLTVLIYGLVFWFASLYTELKIIFSFTGGVMGNILSFIFPSIFYLGFGGKKSFTRYGFVAVLFIIFGFITMGICVFSTIQSFRK